ncbi:MAG: hypothetical protein AAB583_01730 [Patescibacteria group bacterium]
MADIQEPNGQQPLQGEGQHGGVKSFLAHFGIGQDGSANPDSSVPNQEVAPPAPQGPSDFASRLNEINGETNPPIGTMPSMEGVGVVAGPNPPVALDSAIEPPIPEPQMQAGDLEASQGGSTVNIGEPTIGSPTPVSAEGTAPIVEAEETADSSGLAANPQTQEVGQPPLVSPQEAVDGNDGNKVLTDARASLVSIRAQADQIQIAVSAALKKIDARLGTNLSDSPTDAQAAQPKIPVTAF